MEAKKKEPPKPKIVTVASYYGYNPVVPFNPNYMPDLGMGLSTRLVGIEVEVENHELRHHPDQVWVATDDGSLRNNGLEWITKPIPANQAPGALNHLFNEALMDECCFSPRTSVHVHVNCQDMPVEKVANIACLYAIFEKLFYRFTGRGRQKNIFCVPVLETSLMVGIADKNVDLIAGNWSKYSGLNLVPLREKGTIEFRHMHGTRDVGKLTKWVDMLTRLVDFVYKTDVGDLRKMLHGFNREINVGNLLLDIFGPNNFAALNYTGYDDVADCVLNMKQAFLTTNHNIQLIGERDVVNAPFFTTRIQKGL